MPRPSEADRGELHFVSFVVNYIHLKHLLALGYFFGDGVESCGLRMVTLGDIDAADLFIVLSSFVGELLGKGKIQIQDIGIQHSRIKTKIRITLFDIRVNTGMAAATFIHYLAVQIACIGKFV